MKILYQRSLVQFIIENNGQFLLVNIKNKTVQKHKNRPDDINSFLKLGYWYEAKPTKKDIQLIKKLIEEEEKNAS